MARHFVTFLILICMSQVANAQQTSEKTYKLETVKFEDKTGEHEVQCRIIVEAADGGIVIEDRLGEIRNITPEQLKERTSTDQPWSLLSPKETIAALKQELGATFQIVKTEHYIICSNTGAAYSKWCGELLERYYSGFFAFWEKMSLELQRPKDPLVVILFSNKAAFQAFYAEDEGVKTQSSFGFYSIRKNRVAIYDLTENAGGANQTEKTIKKAVKEMPFNVATTVHEATHQLAFNSGLHKRYADTPVWLSEGIAMLLETPDFTSKKWRVSRKTSPWRKQEMKRYLRNPAPLAELVSSDDRFQNVGTVQDAYAEAWSLTYYLARSSQKEKFIAYVKSISKKPIWIWKPENRLKEFEDAFGPVDDVQKRYRNYIKRKR